MISSQHTIHYEEEEIKKSFHLEYSFKVYSQKEKSVYLKGLQAEKNYFFWTMNTKISRVETHSYFIYHIFFPDVFFIAIIESWNIDSIEGIGKKRKEDEAKSKKRENVFPQKSFS